MTRHGRLLSVGAVIKDPLGTMIDHAVVLLQAENNPLQRTWGAGTPIQ